jgi:hypothetical protein
MQDPRKPDLFDLAKCIAGKADEALNHRVRAELSSSEEGDRPDSWGPELAPPLDSPEGAGPFAGEPESWRPVPVLSPPGGRWRWLVPSAALAVLLLLAGIVAQLFFQWPPSPFHRPTARRGEIGFVSLSPKAPDLLGKGKTGSVTVNKEGAYLIDDTIWLDVRSSRRGYLTVVHLNPQGYQCEPRPGQASMIIEPPPAGEGFSLGRPETWEDVLVVVTERESTESIRRFVRSRPPIVDDPTKRGGQIRQFRSELEEMLLQDNKWLAFGSIEIRSAESDTEHR